MLEPHTQAPNFTLPDQQGNEVSLSDFKGQKVVLYFYPKDMTSGCTRQAQNYRDHHPDFEKLGVKVIGISKDTVRSHVRFTEKENLPFTLLADPDRKVLKAYDVLKEKTMYGKKVMGTVRTTYVIDENGMIENVFSKVSPDQDALTILELLKDDQNQKKQ